EDPPRSHPPARRAARIPRQRRRRDAVPLDLDQVGRARDLLGRGRVDSGGQSRDERRAREDDLHGLQDLPTLRPADMRVLVTGATGFVGSHLAEALRRRGDEVTVLARSARKAAALAPLGVRVVAGDLHDRDALRRAVEGQDLVHHVAGVIAARREADFMVANRDGTRNVVQAAEAAEVGRLVFVSSMAAAGPTIKGRPLRGDELTRPVTGYGRSKLAAEQVVTASRLAWTIVRPPIVYGP